ncbi:NADPH:quinone oxidoreductase [Paenibacillus glycanilyticus]|uniref:NADPH:quinone oxidoreductase n=2 Tax=Paenibacillus glycanilyticus TaxID=126569 RepID=A0ABQ6GLB9_9BACL|nr:NADPH:quinone oxidoreductase [Paenibacillus glycanilyticus]
MPIPKDNEVRIKIHAAVVTPSDCAFRRADPSFIRFMYGLRRPKYSILGVEFAGEIESVGKTVTAFQPGDQVYGISPSSFGAHAEYVCLPEDTPIFRKPDNATYEEAAGLCDGALTALIFLRDKANLQPGQKVLINGASGAVGAYAVQLAKYYGAEVTGVCGSGNTEKVKSFGADHLIDYTRVDFTRNGQLYDVIFDAVGKRSFPQCKDALTPTGMYLTTVPSPGVMLDMLRTSRSSGKKAVFTAAGLQQNKANLAFLKKLYEAGRFMPVIDRRYSLDQVAEAHKYVETGHKAGNVIIYSTEESAGC